MCIRDRFNVGTAEKERVLTVPFTFTVEKGAVSAAPVNKVCPMTGDVVNAFHTRDFKGQTVGFCDGDCACLLYTSDAADERSSVDLGGRRIIKKKKNKKSRGDGP